MRDKENVRDRLAEECLLLYRQLALSRTSGDETSRSSTPRPDEQQGRPARQEDAARLQAILDTTVDGIITIGEDTIVQSFNKAAERIFGYTAEEVIGKNVNMLMPSPYKENHDAYVANYLRTGDRKIIGIGREVVGRRKDGATFPLYLAVSEVWVGERRLFTGILRDISELKHAVDEIKSAARFPNENPFPILRIARDGKLLFANASSALLLQTWNCAVGQYLPAPWRSLIAEALRTGENREFEIRCGTTTYSLVFTPVLNADDVNVYGSDITERKRLEEELQRANDRLELRVRQRTAELAGANAVMRDYARKLEYRNMELEEFAHIASHDLQEPLRKIQTFADWVNSTYENVLDDEGQDRLKRLGGAADRMRTLVQALLDYSKLTSRSAAFAPVDLKILIEEVIRNMEKRIRETGGTVEMVGDLPTIEADPVQMYQLFQHLIDNALKFRSEAAPRIKIYSSNCSVVSALDGSIPGGGLISDDPGNSRIYNCAGYAGPAASIGPIELTGSVNSNGSDASDGSNRPARSMEPNGLNGPPGPSGPAASPGKCEIVVEDNGIGFDEKYLHLIFRPFQRLHKKEEYGGTGMGLTICRKVVDRHEGSITGRSAPGKGAAFIVNLPLVQPKGGALG